MPDIRDWSYNYGTTSTATTISCKLPTHQQNDLLLAVCTTDTGTTQAWSLSGWTQLFSQSNTANLAVMYKIAGSSESNPTFTYSISETANVALLSIRDVNTVTPFSETTYATYSESNQDSTINVDNAIVGVGQSFTGTGGWLSSARLYLKKSGSPTGNAVAKIYAHSGTFGTSSAPTGSAVATSSNFDVSTLTTSYALATFVFPTPFNLVNATNYVLTVEYTGTASNFIQVGYDGSSPSHGGNYCSYNGSTWSAQSTRDVCFYIHSFGLATANSSAARVAFPTLTTNKNDSLILYLVAISTAAVPSILEGPVIGLFGKDGSAHSDGCGWGIQRTAGSTPSNIFTSNINAAASKLAVIAVNAPSSGATVIPGYCAGDNSLYVDPINGVTAYNGNTAFAATATTYFGSTLNGVTMANGTAAALADYGINSYHSVGQLTGSATAGTWSGATTILATANKPNVAGKNVLAHVMPSTPKQIQTTDSVALTGTMGLAFGMVSTANTNYRAWHTHGAGTAWGTSRVPMIINDGNTTGRIQNTGILDNTSILGFGFFVSGSVVAPVWTFADIWILDTTIVAGGNSTEPLSISGIVSAASDGKERMSVIQQGSKQILIMQPIQIGDGGTNGVYLKLDATAIEFPQQYSKSDKLVNYCSVDNVAGLTYYAGDSDTIQHTNSIISSPSRYKWGFHASSSSSASYDFSGLQVIGAGTITLNSGINLNSVTFSGCSQITAVGNVLTNCAINASVDTVALLVSSTSQINSKITSCSFKNNTRAIKITTAGTYTFDNLTFSNNTYDIENSSAGTVTINASNGSNPSTYINTGAGSVVINNTVSLVLTGLQTNTEIRIYKVSDDSELYGVENSSTTFQYDYNYTGDVNVYVRIHHIQYQPVYLSLTLGNSSNTIPVQQQFDRNYYNP